MFKEQRIKYIQIIRDNLVIKYVGEDEQILTNGLVDLDDYKKKQKKFLKEYREGKEEKYANRDLNRQNKIREDGLLTKNELKIKIALVKQKKEIKEVIEKYFKGLVVISDPQLTKENILKAIDTCG